MQATVIKLVKGCSAVTVKKMVYCTKKMVNSTDVKNMWSYTAIASMYLHVVVRTYLSLEHLLFAFICSMF